jgi:hypothetical protein
MQTESVAKMAIRLGWTHISESRCEALGIGYFILVTTGGVQVPLSMVSSGQ